MHPNKSSFGVGRDCPLMMCRCDVGCDMSRSKRGCGEYKTAFGVAQKDASHSIGSCLFDKSSAATQASSSACSACASATSSEQTR